MIDGVGYYDFSTNDYLGLLNDPVESPCGSWQGASGSRLLSGTSPEVVQLERDFSDWMGCGGTLLFNSGYHANVGVIPAIVGRGDCVVADRAVHASIWDGIRVSGAQWKRYAHNDLDALEVILKVRQSQNGQTLVVTESVFSMDGDLAPLPELVGLCRRYGAGIFVDESHALGVFGPQGRGLVYHYGLQNDVDIWVAGLGKAWAGVGAMVVGSESLIRLLLSSARSFIFSTALPGGAVAWARSVLDRMPNLEPERSVLRHYWGALGGQSPIFPVVLGDIEAVTAASSMLKSLGIWAPVIKPPTVPKGGCRIRLSLSSALPQSAVSQVSEWVRGVANG